MILTLIPALMGLGRTTPSEAALPAPADAAPQPTDGPGFASLFLALLGGSEGASEPGVPSSTEGGDVTGASEGEEGPFRPGMSAPVGRTTTAGWAALAGETQVADVATEDAVSAVDEGTGGSTSAPEATGPLSLPSEAVRTELSDQADGAAAPTVGVAASGGVASAAATQGVSDVRTPNRALDKLAPELREKVERVIERMAAEHGHKVELVEGYRSPQRQRFLYAQGRTRPGPVVTWTTRSRHMDGAAADLKVEGPWSQRESYVLLQKVAKEEGLGTLGMKDPGHVELASAGDRVASAGGSTASRTGEGEDAPSRFRPQASAGAAAEVSLPRGVARPARVARVASVARVAAPGASGKTSAGSVPASRGAASTPPVSADPTVAMPLEGARVTVEMGSGRPTSPSAVTPTASSPAIPDAPSAPPPPEHRGEVQPSMVAGSRADAVAAAQLSGQIASDRDAVGQTSDRKRGTAKAEPVKETAGLGGSAHTEAREAVGPSGSVTGATGADPMAQVDRVEAIRQAMATANPNRVTVRLDGTAGPVDKVTVDLVDQVLRGQVDVGDAELAARLRANVSEVVRALEEKGYDPQSLAVKLTSNAAEATRDGMAGWLRTDSTAQAMRTILGTQAGSTGRDAHDRSQGEARQGQHDPNGNPERSPRENRRQSR